MSYGKVVLKAVVAGLVLLVASCATMPLKSHPMTIGWKNLLQDDLSNCTFNGGS